MLGSTPGVGPTFFFFANEEFFHFLLASLHFCYIQEKIIDRKMTKLNADEKEKKKFGRIDSSVLRLTLIRVLLQTPSGPSMCSILLSILNSTL